MFYESCLLNIIHPPDTFKFQDLRFSCHTFRSIIIIVRVYTSNIWYDNNVCRVNMQCRWLDITNSWLSGCFPKNMTTMYILPVILNKSNIQTIRDPVLLLWPVFWWYIWVIFLWDIGKNGQHVAHIYRVQIVMTYNSDK